MICSATSCCTTASVSCKAVQTHGWGGWMGRRAGMNAALGDRQASRQAGRHAGRQGGEGRQTGQAARPGSQAAPRGSHAGAHLAGDSIEEIQQALPGGRHNLSLQVSSTGSDTWGRCTMQSKGGCGGSRHAARASQTCARCTHLPNIRHTIMPANASNGGRGEGQKSVPEARWQAALPPPCISRRSRSMQGRRTQQAHARCGTTWTHACCGSAPKS